MSKAKHKYIIQFQNGLDQPNAVAKAPRDVSYFLSKDGYERIDIATMGGERKCFLSFFVKSFFKIVGRICNNSFVVVQYPVYSKKGSLVWSCARWFLREFKKVRIVALIHDLRSSQTEAISMQEEIRNLNKYFGLIAHSQTMIDCLEAGGSSLRCVSLGLFDYVVDSENRVQRIKSNNVCYAGNLANKLFLNSLSKLAETGLSFFLYGSPSQANLGSSVTYCGTFTPDDVSSLYGSWGLVWDGDSLETLSGTSGNYQRYNSPHKASLYIVAGLPLIVSSESAISSIVQDNKIGICVASLWEAGQTILNISESDYNEMVVNVKKYSEKLKSGHNIIDAVKRLEI